MGAKVFLVALGICGRHEKLQLTLRNKCWMRVKMWSATLTEQACCGSVSERRG